MKSTVELMAGQPRVALIAATVVAATCLTAPSAMAATNELQIVVDNDYAVFAGDANGPTRLIYNNDDSWGDQIANAASVDIAPQSGETYVYVVALGFGGNEDFGGTLNGNDVTGVEGAQRAIGSNCANPWESSGYLCIRSSLTGYPADVGGATLYDVDLTELQVALNGATWGSAVGTGSGTGIPPEYTTDGDRKGTSPTGKAWAFPSAQAVVFRYPYESIGYGTSDTTESGSAPARFTFSFTTPTGAPCFSTVVRARQQFSLPPSSAACVPEGSELVGWSIRGQTWNFAPGQQVLVIEDQSFRAVARSPELTITYDANVRFSSPGSTDLVSCKDVEGIERNTALDAPWLTVTAKRTGFLLEQPVCNPEGLRFAGWSDLPTEAGPGRLPDGAQRYAGGEPIPESWNGAGAEPTNDVHLYAMWE